MKLFEETPEGLRAMEPVFKRADGVVLFARASLINHMANQSRTTLLRKHLVAVAPLDYAKGNITLSGRELVSGMAVENVDLLATDTDPVTIDFKLVSKGPFLASGTVIINGVCFENTTMCDLFEKLIVTAELVDNDETFGLNVTFDITEFSPFVEMPLEIDLNEILDKALFTKNLMDVITSKDSHLSDLDKMNLKLVIGSDINEIIESIELPTMVFE